MKVPIGIVRSSHGATPVETWAAYEGFGDPDPDNVGFADLREAQTLFFVNAKNVGMVCQHDLNPDPKPIHYSNKLDPGKRLARWALAHEYGKNIAYTGPIYKSCKIEGDKVRVRFEQRGPGGGLMVGSKGMESDARKNPGAYVEPARETPGEPLKHFRLAGKDNINEDVSKYPPSLAVYANSLAMTYGQDKVPFVYAQPSANLVAGLIKPRIPNSISTEFDAWPESTQEMATKLGMKVARDIKDE